MSSLLASRIRINDDVLTDNSGNLRVTVSY